MILFIVESFTKAKTISKYLGKGYLVKASGGHIKDLPEDDLGVDLETLTPFFCWRKGKKKVFEDIKKHALSSQLILLGTDPDREGEAISYFFWEELKKTKKPIQRVYFYEITEESIKKAVKEPKSIDFNLVKAQFARRVLDRLIGYILSPELQKALGQRGLSVGRVQSPALRLIVEREREIQAFRKKKFYYVKVVFDDFHAYLDIRFEKPENAKPYIEKLKNTFFEVKQVEVWEEKVAPPKPFNTPELQRSANERLKLSVELTMKIAQTLYEEGFITYPRTDAHRMNEKKAKEFLAWIEKHYGKDYVGTLRKFKEKAHVQSAHECIRPTNLYKRPEGKEKLLVFELIVGRTLASLSTPAILENQKVILVPVGQEKLELIAKGRILTFDGWSKFYPHDFLQQTLPRLEKGQILKPKQVVLEERQTQPPKRYTEGSLVKKLEDLGIGRPSTYSTIVKTLKERGYVVLKEGELKPTPLAFQVLDFLMQNFPRLVDYSYTARMEELLDLVEEGKKDWKETVRYLFNEIKAGSPYQDKLL
ncbi:type I DNA topoisomerase [Thermocrinis sp.]